MKTLKSLAIMGALLLTGQIAMASMVHSTFPCGKASTVGLLESTGPVVATTFKAPVLSSPSGTPVRK
jgi:hypothetical protein